MGWGGVGAKMWCVCVRARARARATAFDKARKDRRPAAALCSPLYLHVAFAEQPRITGGVNSTDVFNVQLLELINPNRHAPNSAITSNAAGARLQRLERP
eukprot:scaffold31682_cov31-Tisochrysis_lutea.AAC.4